MLIFLKYRLRDICVTILLYLANIRGNDGEKIEIFNKKLANQFNLLIFFSFLSTYFLERNNRLLLFDKITFFRCAMHCLLPGWRVTSSSSHFISRQNDNFSWKNDRKRQEAIERWRNVEAGWEVREDGRIQNNENHKDSGRIVQNLQ